ncbi:MAG: winged helix-turn-helix domain-containing protein [Eubacteriales bacterium]|nr:winged helix-turn-helix domain-containing protein [Eubacteriales bacterium]
MGRILLIEFENDDTEAFNEIVELLNRYPGFEHLRLKAEQPLCLPGIEIYPAQRKIYRDRREIHLTAKEYDLLCLLAANKGKVLTYEQLYKSVWGEEPMGNEHNAIGCHIRNLRDKLHEAAPDTPFTIRCVREVGYTFEITEESTS